MELWFMTSWRLWRCGDSIWRLQSESTADRRDRRGTGRGRWSFRFDAPDLIYKTPPWWSSTGDVIYNSHLLGGNSRIETEGKWMEPKPWTNQHSTSSHKQWLDFLLVWVWTRVCSTSYVHVRIQSQLNNNNNNRERENNTPFYLLLFFHSVQFNLLQRAFEQGWIRISVGKSQYTGDSWFRALLRTSD